MRSLIFHFLLIGIILLRTPSSEAFKEMSDGVRAYISQHGQITVGDFRDLFQTSRKYALGFMDYMDQQQITRRVGDARILRE